MLRVWLHLPQPFTVPQLCTRPTPSTLSLRLLPVTLLFAVMHALCHRLRWSPRLPHLPNRALSPRSAATANALRAALLGAPSLARRLRERGRRVRKEVTRSMWRDIKLQVRSFAMWGVVMYHRPTMMSITRAANCSQSPRVGEPSSSSNRLLKRKNSELVESEARSKRIRLREKTQLKRKFSVAMPKDTESSAHDSLA